MDGGWEKAESRESTYTQTISNGFIMTQGYETFHFEENPFNITPRSLLFQLLKVHEGHPMVYKDCGRISVKPAGDKRLIGEILRDENPKVYDAVSIILSPWDVKLNEDNPSEIMGKIEDGFLGYGATKMPATLIYVDRGIEIDTQGTRTLSIVPPPQIGTHFSRWMHQANKTYGYDTNENELRDMGRFDIKNESELYQKVVKKLEERFETRILTERPFR